MVQLDFMYVKSDGSLDDSRQPWSTTLVGVDCDTQMPFAVAIPTKSATFDYTVKSVVEWLKRLCHKDVIVRTDGEPSTTDLVDKVRTV